MWRTGFISLLLLLGAGFLFVQEQAREESTVEFARTVTINALVMGEIFYLWNARFLHKPACTRDGLLGSRAVLIAIGMCLGFQVLFIHVPFMDVLFGTAPLDAEAWMRCIAVGGAVFVLVELEKFVFRHRLCSGTAAAEDTEPGSKRRNGQRWPERRTPAQSEQKGAQCEEDVK